MKTHISTHRRRKIERTLGRTFTVSHRPTIGFTNSRFYSEAALISKALDTHIKNSMNNGVVRQVVPPPQSNGSSITELEKKRILAVQFMRKHRYSSFYRQLLMQGRPLSEKQCDAVLKQKDNMSKKSRKEA